MLEQSPVVAEAKQKIVDELLKDLPSETAIEVVLPSENRAYDEMENETPVTLRPMTFEDEKTLIGAKKDSDPVNILLERCTDGLNISQLIPMDKLFLIMKLREISYGDDYNCMLICQSCKAENPTTIHLSQLNVNPVPDDFCDPIELDLPMLGKKAKVRLPRVKDEKFLSDIEKALSQLWRFVVEIDGHTDKAIVSAVLDKLPIKDMRTIMHGMKTDYGIDTSVKFECDTCGGVSVMDLPIDANFFDVS